MALELHPQIFQNTTMHGSIIGKKNNLANLKFFRFEVEFYYKNLFCENL